MIKIVIDENDNGQRLDRFLKKYYRKAPLSMIYKMIRKDIKINGKRGKEDTWLSQGDEISVYLPDEVEKSLRDDRRQIFFVENSAMDNVSVSDTDTDTAFSYENEIMSKHLSASRNYDEFRTARNNGKNNKKARKNFKIAYEDQYILAAEKPFGLLTHGDAREKKNHLANQVVDYLIETGQYNPRIEKTFTPAPANRLDRNTTGLVLFGKKADSLRILNSMLRSKEDIEKYYLTIVYGNLKEQLHLQSKMEKDSSRNKIKVMDMSAEGKLMETIAKPVAYAKKDGHDFTLVEVQLITGRSHQIRAHLAEAGYPIIGDAKYGNGRINSYIQKKFGLSTQFLHSNRVKFIRGEGCLSYLTGKEVESPLRDDFLRIKEGIFG